MVKNSFLPRGSSPADLAKGGAGDLTGELPEIFALNPVIPGAGPAV
jgi:hypothetical protein